jgi:hypothetical protein
MQSQSRSYITIDGYTLGAIEYFWLYSFIVFLALIFWFLGGIIYF